MVKEAGKALVAFEEESQQRDQQDQAREAAAKLSLQSQVRKRRRGEKWDQARTEKREEVVGLITQPC